MRSIDRMTGKLNHQLPKSKKTPEEVNIKPRPSLIMDRVGYRPQGNKTPGVLG